MRFELQTKRLVRYLFWTYALGLGFVSTSLMAVVLGIMFAEDAPMRAWWIVMLLGIIAIALMVLSFRWYAGRFAHSLSYTIEDNIIYIEEGVFTYQRKAIPLDRVTDIRLVQDIVMRWVGIWKLQVQTASLGQMGAEGTLWAIENPKAVRNQLIAQRQSAVTAQRVEPAA